MLSLETTLIKETWKELSFWVVTKVLKKMQTLA